MNARSLFTPVFRSLFGVWLCFSVWSAGTALAADYTVTTTGTAITVTDNSGNNDTLTVSQPNPGKIRFAASGTATRTFSVNGAANTNDNSGDLNLPTTLTNVTVNTAGGDDTVTFSGNLTLPANTSLDLDLQNDGGTVGADRITFAENAKVALSGTASATLKVSRDIFFNPGSGLSTVNGALTLEANQQTTVTNGNFTGIVVANDAVIEATRTGQVTLKGRGGNDSANDINGILNDGIVRGGTNGTLLVQGSSGPGAGRGNRGIYQSTTAASISSYGADVTVTGTSQFANDAYSDTANAPNLQVFEIGRYCRLYFYVSKAQGIGCDPYPF